MTLMVQCNDGLPLQQPLWVRLRGCRQTGSCQNKIHSTGGFYLRGHFFNFWLLFISFPLIFAAHCHLFTFASHFHIFLFSLIYNIPRWSIWWQLPKRFLFGSVNWLWPMRIWYCEQSVLLHTAQTISLQGLCQFFPTLFSSNSSLSQIHSHQISSVLEINILSFKTWYQTGVYPPEACFSPARAWNTKDMIRQCLWSAAPPPS